MRLSVLVLTFFTFSFFATAQVDNIFPELIGETVLDEEVNIPQATMGKYTLIGVAYSKKAEDDLKTWFQPVYQKFIQEAANDAFIPEIKPDVHIYFIPMFTGLKQTAAGAAKRKLRKDADPKIHPNVVVFQGNLKPYEEALGFDKKDEPYFYVLDKEGKIIYMTSGAYSSKKINEIYDLVDESWD